MDVFHRAYAPAIAAGTIGRFALYTLTDKIEQDDHCGRIYNKSLLYLVSNAGEEPHRIPLLRPDGGPLLGMQKYVREDAELAQLFAGGAADWVVAPNQKPVDSPDASRATKHTNIDEEPVTLNTTLARILGRPPVDLPSGGVRTSAAARELRKRLG
jgi:hypothetical protein